MTPNRAITTAVLTGLVAAGIGLYAVTRIWKSQQVDRPAPLPPEAVETTGGQLAAWTMPAAVVAIAGLIAFVAAAGLVRHGIAALVLLSGLGLLIGGAVGLVAAFGLWPVVTVASGAVVTAVALWELRSGWAWPTMSARYDRAGVNPVAIADDPTAMWDALDRGIDPTSLSIGKTAPGEECAR